jgi:ADP-heptose:LPS heptosyltransferase
VENAVLVHLAAGIGNIVLATPLVVALGRMGLVVDLWLSADYPETASLFHDWSTVRRIVTGDRAERYLARIPAAPPFYWRRFRRAYARWTGMVRRPPDALFWEDEQAWYLSFARQLGYTGPAPALFLPVPPATGPTAAGPSTVVLAPGCKTGEMAAKRWPHFVELAERFDDVLVAGTPDDLRRFDGSPLQFPGHVRSIAGRASLLETAELISASGVVVANDCGLGHLAAALGVPTVLLFGPTPDRTLGRFPENVTVLRAGLPCEPCWFGARRLRACQARIDCLRAIPVDRVAAVVSGLLPTDPPPAPAGFPEVCDGANA